MKKLVMFLFVLSLFTPIFAKTYSKYLAEGKEYETQKRWCYALGSYYDALGTDGNPEDKQEAYERYKAISDAIVSGQPGLGKFNKFTLHDEWKNLLIDAEKYGSSICIYDITLGELEEESLDYVTQTATYSAKIDYKYGDRYKNTIGIIEQGLKKIYRNDWKDIPNDWPSYSVSSYSINSDCGDAINVDGVLIAWLSSNKSFDRNVFYLTSNSYKVTLYDLEFSIVDEMGTELVKQKRNYLLGENWRVSISGINPEIMALIDEGKAFLNLSACYLKYGRGIYDYYWYEKTDCEFSDEQLIPMENVSVICWNNKMDTIAANFALTYFMNTQMVKIPVDAEHSVYVLKTEVTQKLYNEVMGENPSYFKGDENPVETVSYYDALYFCNKLSSMMGLDPTYSINGVSDISQWNYIPHQGQNLEGTLKASPFSFHLPPFNDWVYYANGGESHTYAGSDNLDEVAWSKENSNGTTHPVAQKKANGYGLYDMSGNVAEWCYGSINWEDLPDSRITRGGSYCSNETELLKPQGRITGTLKKQQKLSDIGFRIEIWIKKTVDNEGK